jgi:hypothetical protein
MQSGNQSNQALAFQRSRSFFLRDRYTDLGPFVRRELRSDRESSGPGKNSGARQNRPTFAFPPAYTLLVQQAFQLVRFAMARRL